jgi:2-(1,2-epoxy-1,2-dihydrophenyl)acetyl-CoA isomerase
MDLLTEIGDGVARITFNRPAVRNAVNGAMLAEMTRFLEEVEHSRAVRCIVISGAGDHFMAGGDVRGFGETLHMDGAERRSAFEARVRTGSRVMLQMARMPQPIVAKVRGAVAGAGIGIIGAADFVLCGETSIFVLAQVGIGACPDSATTWLLPRLVGARRAKEIALLGDRFGSAEAKAMGLVGRVLPEADLDAAVDALVDRLVSAPRESIQRAKMLLDRALDNSLEAQLDLEAQCFAACAATDDFAEGVRAFIEKRPARFNCPAAEGQFHQDAKPST